MSILNEIYPSHLIDKRHISAKLSNADSQTLDGLENYIIKSKNAKSLEEAFIEYIKEDIKERNL